MVPFSAAGLQADVPEFGEDVVASSHLPRRDRENQVRQVFLQHGQPIRAGEPRAAQPW